MFNYNAKNYDAVTYTFPKTQGQLFNEDLVLNKAPSSYSDDYVDFTNNNSVYMGYTYNSTNDNPFNVTSSNPNFTFIYKTSGFTTDDRNIFANRYSSAFNFMIRSNRCIFGTEYCVYTPSTNPQIVVIRASSNANFKREVWDNNGNILQTSAVTGTYGNLSKGIGFFAGFNTGSEYFRNKFYWMYCSRENLTDSDVLKVIKYNEGIVDFSISPDSASFQSSGGSSAITVTSESNWTASTNNSWITINPSAGTSAVTSTTVTVSENKNFSARTGTVTFTDGENSVNLSVNQEKSPNKVFLKNLYREDEPIRMLIRNGSIIYREFFNLVFNVDVDSLTFDVTGGTQSINITANDNWTMTLPEWLTASSVSGKSSATVYLTAGENTGTTPLTGTITISCGGKTKEISVRQNTNIHYVSCIYWSGGVGTSINYMINTNFNATTDTVMRINYIGRGVANGDTVMGYSFNMPNCPDDNSDYRLFNYRQRAYFDFNTSRIFGGSGEYSYANNVEYDISVGNNYIYDNINSSIVASGTAQTSIAAPLATIYVHVACIKLKSFQIYRGENLVFDGKAAVLDGVVGLYDSVSGTMVTNPDIGLIYEE